MAPYSGALAWKILWMEEPGGLHAVHGVAKTRTRLSDLTNFEDLGWTFPTQVFGYSSGKIPLAQEWHARGRGAAGLVRCVAFEMAWAIFVLFCFSCTARRAELPQPGIEPVPPALEAWSPNHWTTREVRSWEIGGRQLFVCEGIELKWETGPRDEDWESLWVWVRFLREQLVKRERDYRCSPQQTPACTWQSTEEKSAEKTQETCLERQEEKQCSGTMET